MRRDYFQFCDIVVRNAGEETIPGFACMQVVGYESIRTADGELKLGFKVNKPDGKGKVYLINSPIPIAAGSPGDATTQPGAFCLYEGTIPTESETNASGLAEWGPKAGSWAIDKDGTGFVIIGQDGGTAGSEPGFPPVASTKRVRVAQVSTPPATPLRVALITASISVAAMDGSAKTITPGVTAGAATLMKWSGSGMVADGDALYAINLSKTQLRATIEEPIAALVSETTEYPGASLAVFVVSHFDLRALPGLAVADHQAPYKTGAAVTFQLGFEDCPTEN